MPYRSKRYGGASGDELEIKELMQDKILVQTVIKQAELKCKEMVR